MKKFLIRLLALVLICSSLSSTSFANNAETEDESSISTLSDFEKPLDSKTDKRP